VCQGRSTPYFGDGHPTWKNNGSLVPFLSHPLSTCDFQVQRTKTNPRTTLRSPQRVNVTRSPPWAPPVAAVRHTAPWRTSSESPFRRHGLSADGTPRGEGIGRESQPWMNQWMGCFFWDPEKKQQIWWGVRYGWNFWMIFFRWDFFYALRCIWK